MGHVGKSVVLVIHVVCFKGIIQELQRESICFTTVLKMCKTQSTPPYSESIDCKACTISKRAPYGYVVQRSQLGDRLETVRALKS